MTDISFRVSMPTDEGFLGRECANMKCGRYFRVHADSLSDEMYCPYCGEMFERDELLTDDQTEYLTEAAAEQAMEYMQAEISRMFQQSFRGNKSVAFKPGRPYRAHPVHPRYEERSVDSEMTCPACGARFQVDGIFAHCVGCGTQNIAIYDANLELIRGEVVASGNSQRVLRHAYNDLVSTFESICEQRAAAFTSEYGSFQDPYEARRFFKKHAGVDILAALDPAQRLVARRVFHKRHAWQHARGMINDRYVRKVPEDAFLSGQEAQLSIEEFEAAAIAVRYMIDGLPERR